MSTRDSSHDPNNLHHFLKTRRSVRQFQAEPVPEDVVHRILDTARFAPSAHNRQPWRFAVVVTPGEKTCLAAAMAAEFRRDLEKDAVPEEEIEKMVSRSIMRIEQAPLVMILCMTMSEMDRYPDRKRNRAEFRMALQSVALAGGQLLLAAHAEGLGGVWVCAPLFAQEIVRQALDLPVDWEPQGMILLGYPDVTPAVRSRKSLDEVVVFR